MKKCPFCAEQIQDEAVKCRFCGEFLDGQALMMGTSTATVAEEQAKRAEIRRLQQIASGRPSRADTTRKAKGILYLVIIGAILFYSYHWNRKHNASPPGASPRESAISYLVFNAVFGPESPLSTQEKKAEFSSFRGKWVIWEGTVVYINPGRREDLYISLRHRALTRTSDVLLRLPEKNRAQLENLRTGNQVQYAGKLADYGDQSAFITITGGEIRSVR